MDSVTVLFDNLPSIMEELTKKTSELFAVGIIGDRSKGATIMVRDCGDPEQIKYVEAVYRTLTDARRYGGQYHIEFYRLECDDSYALFALATKDTSLDYLKIFTDIITDDVFLSGIFRKAEILAIQ